MDRLLKGRTAIIIAHRLNTVSRADEIMILEDGEIVEHADRVQLVADPHSRFAHLPASRPGGSTCIASPTTMKVHEALLPVVWAWSPTPSSTDLTGRCRGRSHLPGFQGCPLALFSFLILPSLKGGAGGGSSPPR